MMDNKSMLCMIFLHTIHGRRLLKTVIIQRCLTSIHGHIEPESVAGQIYPPPRSMIFPPLDKIPRRCLKPFIDKCLFLH